MKLKKIVMRTGLVLVLAGTIANAEPATPPNIVLILTDDQGWNGLSCKMNPDVPGSGSDFYQTPNMERFANEGMRFSQGYSASSVCGPSRHSIQFGASPAKLRTLNNNPTDPQHCEPSNALPNVIKQAEPGYATAHFGKWHVVVDPADCGYDESDGPTDNYEGSHGGSLDDPKRTFELSDKAVAFMKKRVAADQPFFLQVSYYADHKIFKGSPEMLAKYADLPTSGQHTNSVFAAMNEDLDVGIGRILDTVDRLGIADNTYIFYTADNGYDEGRPAAEDERQRKAWPLSHSKGRIYEGGVRVPFIVRGPGVKPNSFSKVPVIGYDLMPTILELIEPEFSLSDVVEGGSLVPVLKNRGVGKVKRPNDFIHWHTHGSWLWRMSGIMVGSEKLVYTWQGKKPSLVELFDLESDISEMNDLSSAYPEKTKKLFNEMMNYFESVNTHMPLSENPVLKVKATARKKKNVKGTQKKAPGKYFSLQAPRQMVAGTTATIIITHEIPLGLGEQKIHVTAWSDKERIKRKVLKAKGTGTLEASFAIPQKLAGKSIRFAVFLGEDVKSTLQRRVTGP